MMLFKWQQDRKDARQEAEVLVKVHGDRAYDIARDRLMEKPGHASQRDCIMFTEVKRLLGMQKYQDMATRYLDEN